MASKITLAGALTVTPGSPVVSGPTSAPSLTPTINLGLERTAAHALSGTMAVAGSAALPLGSITAVTALVLRLLSGVLEMDISSGLGSAQKMPLAGLLIWEGPVASAITAITLVGTGEVEYVVAGA